MNKRDFLKLLSSFGLGVVAAELYERLFHIPALEKAFREEVTYWIEQYRRAEEQLEIVSRRATALEDEVRRAREELQKVGGEVASLETLLREKEDEVAALRRALAYRDQLEEEALRAVYQEKLEEAISGLRRTVEKYRALLGEDKVVFESAVVKILEEYKITQEKLARLEGMFPLIFLSWTPARVVLDKIYDVRVEVEIVNLLTPVTEVEISLVPVEYRYMIQRYGMREEDYHKVFPREEIKTVKLRARGLIREVFSTVFENLAGGREYVIKVVVRDLLNRTKSVEAKTPYIRQYENLARLNEFTVAVFYYNWYHPTHYIPHDLSDPPLLGFYMSYDNVVLNKHIDWATGHGINVFVLPFFTVDDWFEKTLLARFLELDLFSQIRFSFISTFIQRSYERGLGCDFGIKDVRQEFIDTITSIKKKYGKLPNFWKIGEKPVVVTWSSWCYQSEHDIVDTFVEVGSNKDIYLVGEIAANLMPEANIYPFLKAPLYGLYNYALVLGPFRQPWNWDTPPVKRLGEIFSDVMTVAREWESVAEKIGVRYIPTASPGFDNRKDYRPKNPKTPIVLREKEPFRQMLKMYREKSNIVFITSFNEWFESTQIEPSVGYGFEYLQIVREVF